MNPAPNERLRIVVLGYVIRWPLGGMVWSNLQYLRGLRELGHDVFYVEESGDDLLCYDPTTHEVNDDPVYGLAWAGKIFERLGYEDRWAYWDDHRSKWRGSGCERIDEFCKDADLVLNLAARNRLVRGLIDVPHRAYVDEDPAFNQIRHNVDPAARELLEQHTSFFSFGENIGSKDCLVPDDGVDWLPTRQAIDLESLPFTHAPESGAFTSVLKLDSYDAREWGGMRFALKADSIEPYVELPALTDERLELAAGGADKLRKRLRANGWVLHDPVATTQTPWTYEDFIAQSKAEFGIAKHGYVVSKSGWFSERSTAYLAMGRPVLHQDTGFGSWMELGDGCLAFATLDEARAAIDNVCSRYRDHCAAARDVASEYFDHRHVLPSLLDRAMHDNARPSNSRAFEETSHGEAPLGDSPVSSPSSQES